MLMKQKLDMGKFVVLAEIEPPKGTDVTAMVANAKRVKEKVDAFVVPEMSNAVMRMSSLGAAMILQTQEMETIMQVSCRDRNRLALQADLLAAGAAGITNVMAVTGEDPRFGDHHEAKPVYDLDLKDLTGLVDKFRKGRDMSGVELSGAPDFFMGSTVDAGAGGEVLKTEVAEMEERIGAGTGFFVTPPLFDLESIEPFLNMVDRSKIPVIPTVLVIKSLGMARYMERNMENVHIPQSLISRIQKSSDKAREGIRIASEMIAQLKNEGFAGALISTLGWENRLPEILGEQWEHKG
jgi:methylenetetrahydrofolate reductase (NADPH)